MAIMAVPKCGSCVHILQSAPASYKTQNGNGETETKRNEIKWTEQETTPKILILLICAACLRWTRL